MPTSHDLTIDVSSAAGLDGPARIVATVHLPDTLPDEPTVAFGFPGGGYSRHYYSMDFPDVGAGGQAGFHVDRGWVFVAVDPLQVGDSTLFDPDLLTFETISAANAIVVASVLDQLAAGTVGDGHGAVIEPRTIGFGQSMGGCFTLVLQAQHRCFDAIGILGYSATQTVVPSRPGTPNLPMPWMSRSSYPHNPMIYNPEALEEPGAVSGPDDLATAATAQEHPWTWAFHDDSESRELVQQDMVAMSGGSVPPWRSATTPACAMLMVAPGVVATEAASISVPAFLGTGATDVVPDPWMEPKAYKACRDITVYVCPQMAHMHNFAPTREQFWTRIQGWADGLA